MITYEIAKAAYEAAQYDLTQVVGVSTKNDAAHLGTLRLTRALLGRTVNLEKAGIRNGIVDLNAMVRHAAGLQGAPNQPGDVRIPYSAEQVAALLRHGQEVAALFTEEN